MFNKNNKIFLFSTSFILFFILFPLIHYATPSLPEKKEYKSHIEDSFDTLLVADRYLNRVKKFVDTMIKYGTDHYGTETSPLFAAMLNLETMELPIKRMPLDILEKANTANGLPYELNIEYLSEYGMPPLPIGVRPTDRSPMGCNLEHDIMLIKTMCELSKITGDLRYEEHVDKYLRFFLENCISPVTGLPASGEHICWDFIHEQAFGNIHECYRMNALWDKLYSINPFKAEIIADAKWTSQINNKKIGNYSRHASFHNHHTQDNAAYPRHAGFYIWDYANAYAQTRDPKYIKRIEVLIESRTGIKPETYSVLINPGEFVLADGLDPTLRLLLWDAAGLVPERTEIWREIVKQLDNKMMEKEIENLPSADDAVSPTNTNNNDRIQLVKGGKRTISQNLPVIWRASYGSSGISGEGLLYLTRYYQTLDENYLNMAITIAKRYVESGIPIVKNDLCPGMCGQVISLCISLSQEPKVANNEQKSLLDFALKVADMSDHLFSKNGLFRADGTVNHYEAITGADSLCWSFLQLSCALKGKELQLKYIDVNW